MSITIDKSLSIDFFSKEALAKGEPPPLPLENQPQTAVKSSDEVEAKLTRLKHLSGKHNQSTHGYRFGAAPSLSRARQLRKEGLWGDFKKRAEGRSGVDKSGREARLAKRAEAANGRIKKEKTKLLKVQRKEAKAKAKVERAKKRAQRISDQQSKRVETMEKAYKELYGDGEKPGARAVVNKLRADHHALGEKVPPFNDRPAYRAWEAKRERSFAKVEKAQERVNKLENRRAKAIEMYDKNRGKSDEAFDKLSKARQEHRGIKDEAQAAKDAYVAKTAADRRTAMVHGKMEAAKVRTELKAADKAHSAKVDRKYDAITKAGEQSKYYRQNHPLKDKRLAAMEKMQADGESDDLSWDEKVASYNEFRAIDDEYHAHPYHKKRMAAVEKRSRLLNELDELQAKRTPSKQMIRRGEATLDPEYKLGHGETDYDKTEWKAGADAFSELVGPHPLLDAANPTIGSAARDNNVLRDGRSYARGSDVFMETSSQSTVVHELGHALEAADPGILAESIRWRDGRTQGEKTITMNDATGKAYFRDNELTKKDKFTHPYIGKSYKNASEVLSMGLQAFYNDPVKLAALDPDMFDFIFAVVRMGA